MEDKNSQEPVISELPTQGSGSILATERKKQKKTVEEIADLLNLSAHQIRTIELDQADGLPEPTYVRGYIRSYANVLGLDANIVLKSFLHPNWQQARRLDDMSWEGVETASASRLSSGFNFVRLGVVSTLLIVGVAAWYFGLLDRFFGDEQQAVTQVAVDTSEDIESVQNVVQAEETLNEPVVEVDEQIEESIDLSIALEDVPEDDTLLLEQETAQLILNFSQTSWVDIRDETDARLAYKSYVAGEELIVSSTGPMSVFIGTAEAVSILFNGEEFDMEPYREGVYAKFIVNDN